MFGTVKGQEIVVDFNIERVYTEMLNSVKQLKGFKIKNESKMPTPSPSVLVHRSFHGENCSPSPCRV